jgi:hypothetical protein
MSFFRQLRSLIRIFQRLFGMIESGLVIFFPLARSGSTMRLRGEFVEFGAFSCESIAIVLPILGVRSIL